MQNIRVITAIALLIAVLFSVSSCNKETEEEPMDLPPIESLLMDFSAFSEKPTGADMKGTENPWSNFMYSYATVAVVNAAVTLASILPVTAYSYALQQTPVYLGDQTWEWSFEFPFNSVNYKAILTGERISNEEFSMEMVIAFAATPESGTKWFDGVVRYDHTHATWTLYENGTNPVLEIEWNADFETEEADLTYTIVKAGHELEGSYVTAAYDPAEFFDASYTLSLPAGMTYIEWNTTTIEGRVKSLAQFGDEEWHCWDTKDNNFVNRVCD